MFAPCLLLLLISGSINADKASLHCDFNNTLCGWWNDESAGVKWKINGYDFIGIYAAFQSNEKTARLISPIYDHGLVEDGCFSLDYRQDAFGLKLRIYQAPVSLGVTRILTSTAKNKRKYIIHESELTNEHHMLDLNSVSMFRPGYAEKFQIVIEASTEWGIILIDKIEILQGSKCIEAANAAVTPSPDIIRKNIYYVNTNEDLPSTTPPTTTQSATTAATVPVTTVSPTAVPPPSSAPPSITMVFPAMGQLSGLNGTQPKVVEWTYRVYYK